MVHGVAQGDGGILLGKQVNPGGSGDMNGGGAWTVRVGAASLFRLWEVPS